jgi:hypothetical protein
MAMTGDYWISVDNVECVPRLIERLEQAVQSPGEEFVPIEVIHKAILYSFKLHYQDKEIPIPHSYYQKMKGLTQEINHQRKKYWY